MFHIDTFQIRTTLTSCRTLSLLASLTSTYVQESLHNTCGRSLLSWLPLVSRV